MLTAGGSRAVPHLCSFTPLSELLSYLKHISGPELGALSVPLVPGTKLHPPVWSEGGVAHRPVAHLQNIDSFSVRLNQTFRFRTSFICRVKDLCIQEGEPELDPFWWYERVVCSLLTGSALTLGLQG